MKISPKIVQLNRLNITEKEASDPKWKGAKIRTNQSSDGTVSRFQVRNLNLDFLETFNDFTEPQNKLFEKFGETTKLLPSDKIVIPELNTKEENNFDFLEKSLAKKRKIAKNYWICNTIRC